MAQTVKDFLSDAYQLISPGSPTVPLVGNDQSKGLQFLNELLSSYSGTGLMTTIAQEVIYELTIGQEFVTFADPTILPSANVTTGRLSNMQDSWLLLDGVTYPLISENRNVFNESYKYDPQQGLPRYSIIVNNVNYTTMRIYPAPSEQFELHVFGKFELLSLGINDTMATLPNYYIRYLRYALAKDLSRYKARTAAWTVDLEADLKTAKEDMQSVSPINLTIETDHDDYLNGSWRVRAGI
jgi:hypothetical protein